MLNHITIMGRLTRDPEQRRTCNNIAVTSFTVAVERDIGNNGQKETDFIDCVAWRKTGEFVGKYFTKGRMIVVSGRLQIRTWNDKDGNKRKTAEVVADNCYFGDSKQSTEGSAGSYGTAGGSTSGYGGYGGYSETQAQFDRYTGGQGFTPPPYPGNSYQQQDFAMLEDDDAQLPF